ncbi:MAG: fimbria/pilus outer membrane usher protein [Pseudomonas sp.]|uniref:fimbria/pilus outer membrane usher protein n=1 Tax=Pseudomonas sp. TaxID=306 RepID=UPI003D6FE292
MLAFGSLPLAMAQTPAAAQASDTAVLVASTPQARPSASDQVALVEFNDDFLNSNGPKVDISRYARGNPVLPGDYRVDLLLNGVLLGRTDVAVKAAAGEKEDRVCVTRELLDRVNVDFTRLKQGAAAILAGNNCLAIEDVLDDARLRMDTAALALDFIIPQASLRRTARGYVSPELWDAGITAGTLGYNFNTYRNTSFGQTTTSSYLGLNLGFNAGGWNFRHNGSMSWLPDAGSRYQTQNTFVQRDLTDWKSRLTIGESNTSGEIFDTLPFTGVQVASDDRMLPDSQRGYAPVVRGTADTNARVTIRQNGVLIYDTPVSPGPFVIDDLFPSGYGGNLDVTVTELDGRVRTFSVPYASVPQLLRPDTTRYSATYGKLRRDNANYNPYFAQATVQRGLTNSLTVYGGGQLGENYQSALLGAAVGTPFGALSADVTGASADLGPQTQTQTQTGTSLRLGYSKNFADYGSNIGIAAYRFSTDGFYDLGNAAATRDLLSHGGDTSQVWRPRNRMSVTFSQTLGDTGGSLFITGFTQHYWNRDTSDVQYQVGYGNRWRDWSYSLGVNRVRNANGQMDDQYTVSLSIPLGKERHSPQTSVNLTRNDNSGSAFQSTLSGSAGDDDQYTYGVNASHASQGGTSGSINGQYRSPYASVQASYGQGRSFSGESFGLSGSAVVHAGGVTLSPHTGDTMGLIEAPAAAGAKVDGYAGVTLDGRGYAVTPYLTPYRLNEVTIDPKGISTDVELENTSQKVAPRAGAVVRLQYKTVTGRAMFITSTRLGGAPLPFGADVTDGEGGNVGVVAQGGRIFARLKENTRELQVNWGTDGKLETCRIDLSGLPARSGPSSNQIETFEGACLPAAAAPPVVRVGMNK